jgi:hypothetical protein
MDIKESLEAEHSKTMTTRIVNYVGDDARRFKALMDLFLKGEYRITQRAAWPISYCVIEHPQFIKPYYAPLMKKMQEQGHHPAITRNILRMFQDLEVPEKYCGTLIDLCIKFMMSELQPTAIRAFSITVACNICKRFPELKQELLLVINDLQNHPQLPAVRHRIKMAIKELRAV